jgi:heat shock protein HslJ
MELCPMYFRFFRFNAALLAAVSLTACQGSSPTAPSPSSTTTPGGALSIDTNAVWKLQSLVRAGSSETTINDPSVFTLSLAEDKVLRVQADCNRATGGYATSGSTITVGPLAATRAYCASAPIDTDYLSLLGGDSTVSISGSTLQLSSSRGTLKFTR